MRTTNIIIGLGFLTLAYVLMKQSKKNKPALSPTNPQNESNQEDTMVSQYSIVPLPDLKNYKFQTIAPTTIIGNTTTTTPIIIATPTR